MAAKLVLLRHGQSAWNLENLFTGWTDVDLTAQGREEARAAGKLLAGGSFDFGIAFGTGGHRESSSSPAKVGL